jgi:hypothetical protein
MAATLPVAKYSSTRDNIRRMAMGFRQQPPADPEFRTAALMTPTGRFGVRGESVTFPLFRSPAE